MCTIARPRSQVGFTLLELLVATTVAVVLVGAMADALGMFGEQVEQVRAESDRGPEEAVALMSDMVRYAWSVEQPAADQLDVVDAHGRRTSFQLDDGTLRVTRPSGAQGELLDGVSSLGIQVDTQRRLRELPPRVESAVLWERPASAASPANLTLETGLPLALGFIMSSEAPDTYDLVADVDEHVLEGALQTLVLSLMYVPSLPADPNIPIVGDDPTGPGKSKTKKVVICHIPPGNPANAHTLSVSENALEAHLAHGDFLGPCEAPPPSCSSASLTITLFEARAPDDARPVGPPLASMHVVATGVPTASTSWVLTTVGAPAGGCVTSPEECAATTPDGKVVMCHVPPGNPSNAHPITVSPHAVPAHLAHGDYFGICGQHESETQVYTLAINGTPSPVALDLSPLHAAIEPGRAYTLVLDLESAGYMVVGAEEAASAANTGVAQSMTAGGPLQPLGSAVPFRVEGSQDITQTAEHEPISRVVLNLEMDDGQVARGSSAVTSQVAVPGPWSGVVPGELEALEQ